MVSESLGEAQSTTKQIIPKREMTRDYGDDIAAPGQLQRYALEHPGAADH